MASPFPGCGKLSKTYDPLISQYLIHHFYPDEPEPEMSELTSTQKECLSKWAQRFHSTPISTIEKNENKTKLLKQLLRVGRKKITKHIQPVKTSLTRQLSSETGFSTDPTDEPTVDEILEDPFVYIDWKLLERLKKGGSTRRKKSSGRKTRGRKY